ncbi:P-loop containing nucleoside triphosphate hydrolase protein [Hyaloscypha variabilis F]|uniref:P-loop containing nucleoside triphosphate hydrolase protein n=1 Tax=Hyaloscypha variabilis (strain UAMH 11265 / GT02V1 / F) TaxID=1149755 RepID=A0A2J6RL72_HYAVF|nr:P-loop containing nucleoside triphosphate hydrolase protein [Hyaloscypha variabilis F]
MVDGKWLWMLKVAAIIIYSSIRLSLLVHSADQDLSNKLFISSNAVEFVSSIYIIVLSSLEHLRSPRPSILLNAYLFLAILFDIAQARTLWLASTSSYEVTYCRLFTTSVVARAVILFLESQHKSKWIQWDANKHSPEETSGVFGLGAYVWLNGMFLAGYKKVLVIDDLFHLDQNMLTESLEERLTHQVKRPNFSSKRFGLARALAKTLLIQLLLPIGPRIALIGFRFCQPFLINTLLDHLQVAPEQTSRNQGYGLIGATIFIYSGIAVSTAFYWYLHERTLCMFRGALAGCIYRKTTEIKLSAAGDSAALTLMSTDVEQIRKGLMNLHEFWANSIEAALAAWLLQRRLGAAVAAPLIVVFCCITCGAFANTFTGRRQKVWMSKIQKRVGLTASVVSNMKHLKISGLSRPVESLIQSMRVNELNTASRFRTVYVIVIVFGYVPWALCPVMTFAVTSRTLDVTTIFTSISYLLLLTDPLGYLFQNSPYLLGALACLNRIQAFLEKDPRIDLRISKSKRSTVSSNDEGPLLEYNEEKSRILMTITDGNFGWELNKFVLKNINLDIPESRLTMVVGPVACGKSSLCKALLGEMPVSQFQVCTINTGLSSRRVGYCDETPYLSNTSIRENIIGISPFDTERYEEVIEATMLQHDFTNLVRGDQTKIGSNGITLSGGQKQRVSMARALYLDSDFFVFDDILSGLDANTEEHVFQRVFGPDGLLRRRNATSVLCTHTVRHLPSADHIVALGGDGTIVEQGTFDSLVANHEYIHSLGIKAVDLPVYADGSTPLEATPPTLNEAPTELVPSIALGDRDRMMGDSTVYRYYLGSLGKTSITAFLVFGLGWGFFYNWGNIWLEFWSKDVSSSHPSRSNSFYVGLYAVFQLSYIGSLLFCFLICFRTMIRVSGSKLHQAALRTLINAPLRFFTSTDTGIITNLFSQDMSLIDHELPIALTNLVMDICNATGMAAVIASSSPFLAIAYPFMFILLYVIQKFYLRTSRQLRLLDLESKGPLYTHFLDTIKDVATFRAFGWVQNGIETNNKLLDTSQRPTYLLAMVQRWLLFTLQLLVAVLAIAVVTLATQLRSSTGLTGASLVTLMTFGDILNYIITWYTQIETSIGAVSRLKKFSEQVKSESKEDEVVVPTTEWPLEGGIQITDVSASYSNADQNGQETTDNERLKNLAIKNLSLTIRAGERVAICGRTGSGKSSTILLLLRLLDPLPTCAENITIDSLPLHKIDRTTLRERIIAIPQDAVFLPDGTSIMSNLDPFNVSTEVECTSVLNVVGLTSLLEERGGLDQGLSPDTLSQGQRQLFSLARAILRRRIRAREYGASFGEKGKGRGQGGILLLDEITSGVDHETERMMMTVIETEFEGYTVVMVSHRLEMVMGFDRVLVMDRGSVVEDGAPGKLVEREGGRFRDLWLVGNRG